MQKEESFGIIPLRWQHNHWDVYLVKHHAGHWAFPKGHAEENESVKETAERELKEETNLEVSEYFENSPLEERYKLLRNDVPTEKTVTYFLARACGEAKIQEEEIEEGLWLPLEQAKELMTFEEGKRLCTKIQELLPEVGTDSTGS